MPTTLTLDFALAGRAIFTCQNTAGDYYTFKITAKAVKAEDGTLGRLWFASLLTGPVNTCDYTYLGRVVPIPTGEAVVKLTAKSRYREDSTPVRVLAWALAVMAGRRSLPPGYWIRHEGRCGRCGRVLTVPSSLDSGLGPECAGRVAA